MTMSVLRLALCGLLAATQPQAAQVQDAPASPAPAKAAVGSFGLDLSARDLGTRPGDDFDRYASGAWDDRTVLRDDQAGFGSLAGLEERSEAQLVALMADLRVRPGILPGSDEQKVRDLYLSFNNMAARNALGIKPLRPLLARINRVDSMSKLIDTFGRVEEGPVRAPIVYGIGVDPKDPRRYLVSVRTSGLGLPNRDYYFDRDPQFVQIRAAYVEQIEKMLGFAGIRADVRARAEAVLALETELARPQWPRSERRDLSKTYNVVPWSELARRYPDFDWEVLRKSQDMPVPDVVNVQTPSAMAPLIAVIRATPFSTWRDYLRFHAVQMNSFLLSAEISDAAFAFQGTVLYGQPAQVELSRRSVFAVGSPDFLGDAVDRLYVARYFSPEARTVAVGLVDNLRLAMRSNLEGLDWMGEQTRTEALRKLSTSRPMVGVTRKGRDFRSVQIVPDDLAANARAMLIYYRDESNRRVGTAPDREEWRMQAFEPNAYYNPSFNQIYLPAAVLQAPLFDVHADPAVNYGAIGALIGHELGHGFDDQGSKYDSNGVLRNWWTDQDRARFEARAAALGAQYAKYCPFEGQCVNPTQTVGENIGDLAGLSVAYKAYQLSLGGKPAPVLEGLTGDQRFFLAYAQLWRSKARPEAVRDQLKSDGHSPKQYRINGAVRNMDAWYVAFGVKPGDKLYLPPAERVRIW